jgi:dockerin type I repeat protein
VLFGDVGGNRTVNSTDVSQVKLQSGTAVTAANFRNDVGANGAINSSDVSTVKLASGTALP